MTSYSRNWVDPGPRILEVRALSIDEWRIQTGYIEAFVDLWSITGDSSIVPVYYPTKSAAEMAALMQFPDEDPFARYGRLRCNFFVLQAAGKSGY